MVNVEVSRIFNEIADLLEITGGDRFRINSFRKVSRAIDDLTEDLADVANRDELQKIPGIGKGTADRIKQYLQTGRIKDHQELLKSVPAGLLPLLDIPGLGPKKVQQLYRELEVRNIDDLRKVIDDGRAERLSGFGAKSIANLKEGIAFVEKSGARSPLGAVLPMAEEMRRRVGGFKGVKRVEIAGSARRAKETVGDLDLLCVATDGKSVIKAFTGMEDVNAVRASGDTKASILVDAPIRGEIQIDLRVIPEESFGAAWQYFTGSKEHNVRLRELAVKKKWKLNEYGLFDGERQIAGGDETGIYKKLGLAMIPPELREDRGEIEAKGRIPGLLTFDDIRGDLHVHTTASDGRNTIEEMAEAARQRGYTYLAITEHSKSSAIAGGLSIDDLLEHAERIRGADRKLKGFTLLAGIECDILADGSLDYDDDVLAQLDWVVASIHSAQRQDKKTLTRRALAAIENPHICALGHPSGRLLGKRDAMDLNWDEIFSAADEHGTALEINASWQRLDLKDVHVRQAVEAGCRLVINTDAHATDQLDQMTFGVATARRGWAPRDRVINTFPAADLRKWIDRKRKGK